MMQQIDLTAVYVGVVGYAVAQVLFLCISSRTPKPAKKVDEDESDGAKTQGSEQVAALGKAVHSVLPCLGSIQLAVIVVAVTLAKSVPVPPQPQIAAGFMYALYRLHLYACSRTTAQASAPTDEQAASQKEAPAPAPEAEGKERPRPHFSVLPSAFSIQLAVLVVAGMCAREIGMPFQPMMASAIVFLYYRCVLYFMAPVAGKQAAKDAASVAQPTAAVQQPVAKAAPSAEAAAGAREPAPAAAAAGKPPKAGHSVLPSVRSVQLAVLVAAVAAATHLEMPIEPKIACIASFVHYRFVLQQFAPAVPSEKKLN
mmetsp:Transcript_49398/g.152363  ORF Transcript_49398/g.152363 Transcript_49398/m.152363 type:complete len:313 (+) Transcript_49398:86-1024(+)